MGQIPVALARDRDQLIDNSNAFAVCIPGPVLIDAVGLAWANQVSTIIVINEKEPIIAVNHSRQNLANPPFRFFIVRGGIAINKVKPVARLSHVIAQLIFFCCQKLGFQ